MSVGPFPCTGLCRTVTKSHRSRAQLERCMKEQRTPTRLAQQLPPPAVPAVMARRQAPVDPSINSFVVIDSNATNRFAEVGPGVAIIYPSQRWDGSATVRDLARCRGYMSVLRRFSVPVPDALVEAETRIAAELAPSVDPATVEPESFTSFAMELEDGDVQCSPDVALLDLDRMDSAMHTNWASRTALEKLSVELNNMLDLAERFDVTHSVSDIRDNLDLVQESLDQLPAR